MRELEELKISWLGLALELCTDWTVAHLRVMLSGL